MTLADERKATVGILIAVGTWFAEALRLPLVQVIVAAIVLAVVGSRALSLFGETDTFWSLLMQISDSQTNTDEKSVSGWSVSSALTVTATLVLFASLIDQLVPTHASLAKRLEKFDKSGMAGVLGISLLKLQELSPGFFLACGIRPT